MDSAVLGEVPGRKVSPLCWERGSPDFADLLCNPIPTHLAFLPGSYAEVHLLCRKDNHHVGGGESLSRHSLEHWEVWLNGRVCARPSVPS